MAECPLDLSTRRRRVGERGADSISIEKHDSSVVEANGRSHSLSEKVTSSSRYCPQQAPYYQRVRAQPCTCNACQQRFPSLSELDRHSKAVHKHEKLYVCVRCEKKYATDKGLKEHISRVHERERTHKCLHCEAAFVYKYMLIAHLKIHTGEKPFVCDQCDTAFTKKASLERHIMSHTGEKPFGCGQCDTAFCRKENLKRHILSHTRGDPTSAQNRNDLASTGEDSLHISSP